VKFHLPDSHLALCSLHILAKQDFGLAWNDRVEDSGWRYDLLRWINRQKMAETFVVSVTLLTLVDLDVGLVGSFTLPFPIDHACYRFRFLLWRARAR